MPTNEVVNLLLLLVILLGCLLWSRQDINKKPRPSIRSILENIEGMCNEELGEWESVTPTYLPLDKQFAWHVRDNIQAATRRLQ